MRKPYVVIFFLIVAFPINAQKTIADSSLRTLKSQQVDSLQIRSLLLWMDLPENGIYDSAVYYPTQIIQVGQKQRNKNVEAIGEALLGYYHHIHEKQTRSTKPFYKSIATRRSKKQPQGNAPPI